MTTMTFEDELRTKLLPEDVAFLDYLGSMMEPHRFGRVSIDADLIQIG